MWRRPESRRSSTRSFKPCRRCRLKPTLVIADVSRLHEGAGRHCPAFKNYKVLDWQTIPGVLDFKPRKSSAAPDRRRSSSRMHPDKDSASYKIFRLQRFRPRSRPFLRSPAAHRSQGARRGHAHRPLRRFAHHGRPDHRRYPHAAADPLRRRRPRLLSARKALGVVRPQRREHLELRMADRTRHRTPSSATDCTASAA